MRARRILYAALAIAGICVSPGSAAPSLVPGVWLNITPAQSQVGKVDNVFCQGMAVDRKHPSTLYLCVCAYDTQYGGLYKSADAGSHWNKVGALDEPIHLAIDPDNPDHLYCVDGVRGSTLGFWVSENGGDTWTQPPGYVTASKALVGTQDLYSLSVDPTDFKHVLVSFHSPWSGSNNAGVLESKDGGASWRAVDPPGGSAGGYGMSIFFLYDPQHSVGNASTWLFTAQAGGFFRTTDAGAHWSQCYDKPMTHGGNQIYRSKTGALYSGGYQYPVRSTNNGESWTQVTQGLDYAWYIGIAGDGNFIYTAGSGANRPFWVSPETDGLAWTPYQNGSQTFSSDPFEMEYDSTNGILYSANWEGLYALKVLPPSAAIGAKRWVSGSGKPIRFPDPSLMARDLATVERKTADGKRVRTYDFNGHSLGGRPIGNLGQRPVEARP